MPIDAERAAKLAAILAKRFPACHPHLVARAVVAAMKAGRRARKAEAHACSYPETNPRREKRFATLATTLAAQMHDAIDAEEGAALIAFEFGGDPRGPCAWMRIRDAAGAWMPGDGWARDAGFALS